MTVYLVHNTSKPLAADVSLQAAKLLLEAGAQVILPPELEEMCQQQGALFLNDKKAIAQADTVVTVGGDGTFLHTAKQCLPYGKPVLGINLGRTGFLATCEISEMPQKLVRLAQNDFSLENRVLVSAQVEEKKATAQLALNDVVLYSGRRVQTLDFDVYCDDILVNHCRGDGVIVATPTGSTAYSLSAGGPILDARIQGLVVTPICAHSLQGPAMVFAADRRITLQVHSAGRNQIFLSSDGGPECRLADDAKVHLELSRTSVKLIAFNPADQFNAIDKKLRGR